MIYLCGATKRFWPCLLQKHLYHPELHARCDVSFFTGVCHSYCNYSYRHLSFLFQGCIEFQTVAIHRLWMGQIRSSFSIDFPPSPRHVSPCVHSKMILCVQVLPADYPSSPLSRHIRVMKQEIRWTKEACDALSSSPLPRDHWSAHAREYIYAIAVPDLDLSGGSRSGFLIWTSESSYDESC